MFDLDFIRAARSEYIAELMGSAEKSENDICTFDGNIPENELFFPDGLASATNYLTDLLTIEYQNLKMLTEKINSSCIVSKNRANDIAGAVSSIRLAVRNLARQVEAIS